MVGDEHDDLFALGHLADLVPHLPGAGEERVAVGDLDAGVADPPLYGLAEPGDEDLEDEPRIAVIDEPALLVDDIRRCFRGLR